MTTTDVPSAAATSPVLVERRGTTAILTLNRPAAMNALSVELVAALDQTIRDLRGAGNVRALIITGAGSKSFCAGADLKERRAMSLADTRRFLNALGAAVDGVAAFPAPVIAAINGAAFGGGFELALACDIRLGADNAQLGLVEVRLGIIPGAGGTQRLARVAGVAVAKELILTGRRIDAVQARALGIIASVHPAADLLGAALAVAAEVAAGGPLAVAQAKRAIDGGLALPLDAALALERSCYEVVLTSEDREEGLAAFVEKRPPVFQGK
ncbi:MAG TPA: enoyl-CoA hydratase-related protein [Polyangia bacterium]|nr:enoyl-CoA hydratase-related protein [Polyangia bacterium]